VRKGRGEEGKELEEHLGGKKGKGKEEKRSKWGSRAQ
jgi:hypothetical protein